MSMWIALLRGVNVTGRRMVAMAELRAFAEGLGLAGARTLLQSGNLVFQRPAGQTPEALERRLEAEAARQLGVTTDFLVRDRAQWAGIVAGNPFHEAARLDPGHLLVVFLKSAPNAAAVEALRAAVKGPEVIHVNGREAYITYPAGVGNSKLTNVLIEKRLATRGTARNWNTVLKLEALAGG